MTSLEVISLAGLLSGVLDLTATSTLVRRTQGIPLERLLQRIASGAFGPLRIRGRKENRNRWPVLPLLDLFHRRLPLLRKQPQAGDPHRSSTTQRSPIRRRGSSGDESNCAPALRCSNSLFRQSFPNPAGHSYSLRRSADRARREPSFAIGSRPTRAQPANVPPLPASPPQHNPHCIPQPRCH